MIDQPEILAALEEDIPLELLFEQRGSVRYYRDLIQGTDEWRAARRGLLTASEMDLIITPTLKVASNGKERAHLYELLAQRITGHVEPSYVGDDMLRGWADEDEVRKLYSEHFAPVQQVGFVTNDEWGFTLGYSPDGLVGDDGLIEIKSRRQKFQVQTLVENAVPPEFMIQIQTGLLVSRRQWCDYVSYCGGLPMTPIRVLPDEPVQEAILAAASAFEQRLGEKMVTYHSNLGVLSAIPTERIETGDQGMTTDLSPTIVPKSDQLNADDLLTGPRTVTVTKVSLLTAADQPIAINFDGDNGKPYKPCKSMRRVMVSVWGSDGAKYAGRRMTLFRDPNVTFGSDQVGGIRISHMSNIERPMTMALTVSRARRSPYTVQPLAEKPAAATASNGNGKGNGGKMTPAQMIETVSVAPSVEDLDGFEQTYARQIQWLHDNRPQAHEQLVAAITARRDELDIDGMPDVEPDAIKQQASQGGPEGATQEPESEGAEETGEQEIQATTPDGAGDAPPQFSEAAYDILDEIDRFDDIAELAQWWAVESTRERINALPPGEPPVMLEAYQKRVAKLRTPPGDQSDMLAEG